MLTDLLKAKGPFLRLWLGAILALEMVHETSARQADVLFPQEQGRPTEYSFIDSFLGNTTQTFVLNLDLSVLSLMVSGFMSTVLRPEFCAFIVLPCRDSNALFFFRQDRRTRRLLGARRYERLTLHVQFWRNRLRLYMARCGCLPPALRPANIRRSLAPSAQHVASVSSVASALSATQSTATEHEV